MKTALMTGAATVALVMGMASAQPAPTANPLAPTAMAAPVVPKGNHYVCYPVKAEQFKPITVKMQDQFGPKEVTVVAITKVCAPANKTMPTGAVSEMVDPRLHLTCYQVRAEGKLPPSVITNDQFGTKKVMLSQPNEICLPAGKTVPK